MNIGCVSCCGQTCALLTNSANILRQLDKGGEFSTFVGTASDQYKAALLPLKLYHDFDKRCTEAEHLHNTIARHQAPSCRITAYCSR